MKIENLQKAINLSESLKMVNSAIKNTENFLNSKSGDSLPGVPSSKNSLYGFNISEYSDGSGQSISLSGCGIGMSILKFTLKELKAKKSEIEKEIESL